MGHLARLPLRGGIAGLCAVAWIAGDPDCAQQFTCHLCDTITTTPTRRELMGCDEPLETALAADGARPGHRGADRMLHVGPGGFRSWRCPRQWANDPIAREGWSAYLWWEKGQVASLYAPDPVPAKIIEAIRVLHGVYTTAHQRWWDRHHPPPPPGGTTR